jgi:hypothetical protein
MKTRKTLFILLGIFLFLLLMLAGAGLYYYTHPQKVKSFVEKAVSRATDASFSIRHLDYSLNPIRIHANGIVFKPAKEDIGFSAEIEDFVADCVLKGSFGQKTLVFKNLALKGFKCRFPEEGPPSASKDSAREWRSSLKAMSRSLFSFFLFEDFRLEGVEISDGHVTADRDGLRIKASGLSGRINANHLLSVQGSMLVKSPAEQAILSIPDFYLNTNTAISVNDPRLDFTAVFANGRATSPHGKIKNIQGGASIRYDRVKHKIAISDFKLTLQAADLKGLSRTETAPFEITIEAKGAVDLKGRDASIHDISVDVKDLLNLNGWLDIGFQDQHRFEAFINEARLFTPKVMSFLQKRVTGKLKGVKVSGPVDFSGMFSGVMKKAQWVFDGNGVATLKKSPVSYRDKKLHINGLMTAQVRAEGPLSNLRLSGKLTGNQVAFKGKGLSVQGAEGVLIFSGAYPDFEIAKFHCRIPEITSLTDNRTFSVEKIKIDATRGRFNVLTRFFEFPDIRLKSSPLSNILATFKMSKGRMALTAKGKEVGLIKGASSLKLLPAGWVFNGLDAVDLSASTDKTGTTSFSAKLGYEKFQFHNPQQTHVGENISLHALVSGRIKSSPLALNAVVQLSADRGEVLMDRFYFNLKENPLSVKCNGGYRDRSKRVTLDRLTLDMKKVASAQLTGTLFRAGNEFEGDFSVRIPDIRLKGPFQRLIQEPFQTEKPALSKVSVDGMVGADLTLRGKLSSWLAHGRLTWKDGALVYGDSSVALTGIQLSLPVWLAPEHGEKPTQDSKGHLSVQSMIIPHLPKQDLKVPIGVVQNGWVLPAATTLDVPGGTVRIGPSRINGLMGPAPAIDTALHFENLQLESVLSPIWPQAAEGSADGHLNPIHIERGALESSGEIKANVFGGSVALFNVGARGLFTTLPVYHLNARWHHLNLAEMTEGTSFGKIEGVLNGYAKNVEVTNGQLQRFDLLLDTVKTDDVPQKISVKAVDNIARLGGGQSPFAGVAGMFISFFKEFPYRKIGVRAKLGNDVFRINGTIRENGKEYLVKRGFFSGVDVINQNKDNRVGFKDMLKRIKRISNSKDGPVIR